MIKALLLISYRIKCKAYEKIIKLLLSSSNKLYNIPDWISAYTLGFEDGYRKAMKE